MPDCPKCKVMLGLWERGCICPKCMRLYFFDQIKLFPNYDLDVMVYFIELFEELNGLRLLGPGANRVTVTADAMVIDRLGDIF
jgi:hypothetical protein